MILEIYLVLSSFKFLSLTKTQNYEIAETFQITVFCAFANKQ